ncbi:unnamed protein product [Closterium sp. NIES-53]
MHHFLHFHPPDSFRGAFSRAHWEGALPLIHTYCFHRSGHTAEAVTQVGGGGQVVVRVRGRGKRQWRRWGGDAAMCMPVSRNCAPSPLLPTSHAPMLPCSHAPMPPCSHAPCPLAACVRCLPAHACTAGVGEQEVEQHLGFAEDARWLVSIITMRVTMRARVLPLTRLMLAIALCLHCVRVRLPLRRRLSGIWALLWMPPRSPSTLSGTWRPIR